MRHRQVPSAGLETSHQVFQLPCCRANHLRLQQVPRSGQRASYRRELLELPQDRLHSEVLLVGTRLEIIGSTCLC